MRPILKNKFYLYLTEFFAGMSVMAVELGASRLLAPYFSSSQIVWTIIIGTIMIAMALGNIYGGRKADRDPDPDKLYRRILVAAVWIALIPVLGKYIILGISAVLIFSVNANFLVWAAFAACMVIFVFPLFLLGTVTPSLAKYTMENLDDNARIVGTLGAANTIGSIIGTFVPTFVTIPAVGTSITFLVFAGILLALALAYFFSGKGRKGGAVAGLVIFLLCCAFGHKSNFAFWKTNLLYEGESIYNYLQVEETDRSVILSTNVLFGVQSIQMKDEGLTGMYYDYALAGPLMANAEERDGLEVLILGMGTGTYGSQCARYFPGVTVEGVEIDGKITALAREYFALPDEVSVTTYDGRAFLQAVDRRYDVILVDAYQDITIPFQMASTEFFTLVREHLNEGGVLVVNMNMRGEEDSINQYLADTISTVFTQVYTVDVTGGTNRELFASNDPRMLENLSRNRALCADAQLRGLMERVEQNLRPYAAGDRVMTDDRAPVELLSMRVIDDLIRGELERYREIYERDGIRGLIDGL
jgi:spermidine synthase